jgi:hypothetical protein
VLAPQLAISSLAVAGLCGCAPFKTPDELPGRILPTPRLSPDSVILEVGYALLPIADQAAYDEVWQLSDEQVIALDLRQELTRNGLRCGVLGKNIPEKIRTLMDKKGVSVDQRGEDLEAGDLEIDRQPRRLQCRAARKAKILCSRRFEQLTLLMCNPGTGVSRPLQSVSGAALQQAQCLIGLKPYPLGDGRVQLDLLPEIEHGELKQQWVGGEGQLIQKIAREKISFDALRLSLSIAPGQMVVVSTADSPRGLGEHFFVESASGTPSRWLLFIRLALTQQDNLFAPELSALPLATPGE